MSLLLEALKKAVQEKKEAEQNAEQNATAETWANNSLDTVELRIDSLLNTTDKEEDRKDETSNEHHHDMLELEDISAAAETIPTREYPAFIETEVKEEHDTSEPEQQGIVETAAVENTSTNTAHAKPFSGTPYAVKRQYNRSRYMLRLGIAVLVLSLFVVGGFFLYQTMLPATDIDFSVPPPHAPKPVKNLNPPVVKPTPSAQKNLDKKDVAMKETEHLSASENPMTTKVEPPTKIDRSDNSKAPPAIKIPVPAQQQVAPTQPTEKATSVIIRQEYNTVNNLLQDAYHAYTKNELDHSRRLYLSVLEKNEVNRDALLGLAAIAQKQNNTSAAELYYRQILLSNTDDHEAIIALINMRSGQDFTRAENQLKRLAEEYPNQPRIYFSLGNKYVHQQRWPEAQKAFYHAVTLDSNNPDYLFNLAVSLDRLKQKTSALFYYKKTLASLPSAPSMVDKRTLEKRIRQLNEQ